jgi:DNA replication protein DnaC
VSELVATRIREHAERLRLAHLAEGLDGLVDRAEQQTMGYLDFLDLILEEEVGVREGRRFRNALKLSGLPHHKGLDGFDFAFQPELDARKVRDLAALGFVEAKANVCFLGPPGVGKTMLAVGLAIAACQTGYSVSFTTLDDLVRNLKDAEASGRFAKKLQTYLKPAVLVVDEVGYLPLARPDANMVFQLVARRYERGSILLTSNKAFSEWGSVFGDDVLASAILDRLLHHCEVISINGPSYRLKDRLKPSDGGGALERSCLPCYRHMNPYQKRHQHLTPDSRPIAVLMAAAGRGRHGSCGPARSRAATARPAPGGHPLGSAGFRAG